MPAIGAKECIFNLNLAFLDPGDVALASDPGYPVYTGGPLLAGGEPVLMPLRARARRSPPTSTRSPPSMLERARLMFINYPNNPTGRDRARRAVRARGRARARARHPGRARQRLQRDDLRRLRGAVVPGHPRRQGGRRRGVLAVQGLQHDRLALRGDRRQRRGDRAVLAAEVEHRLGPVRGRPAGRRGRARARGRRRRQGDERGLRSAAATSSATRSRRPASRSPRRRGRSTSGRRCPRASSPPPRTASTCSSRRPS